MRSVVNEVRDKLVVFTHEMFNDDSGEVAARTTLKGLHMDTVRRKACPFEPRILAAASRLAAGHAQLAQRERQAARS